MHCHRNSVQTAVAPVTAGVSGVTGLTTGAVGVDLVGFGSAVQIISKFGKFAVSGGNEYFAIDNAVSSLNLGLGLRAKPAAALSSVIAGKVIPKNRKNPCD